jgi:hypothetical protein
LRRRLAADSRSEVARKVRIGEVVAAGPDRLIALALACAIGVWVAKKKPTLPLVVWLVAVSLSLRCVFESVMDPYYLVPGLAMTLVAAATLYRARLFVATAAAAAICTWISYRSLSAWPYYLGVTGTISVSLTSARPGESRILRRVVPGKSAVLSGLPPDS